MLLFKEIGGGGGDETGGPGEIRLEVKERTNNKLNPPMASTPGLESGPHWWKARALITVPPLPPPPPPPHHSVDHSCKAFIRFAYEVFDDVASIVYALYVLFS